MLTSHALPSLSPPTTFCSNRQPLPGIENIEKLIVDFENPSYCRVIIRVSHPFVPFIT